jgi:ABC-type glucose/galactose transport system permease subunit
MLTCVFADMTQFIIVLLITIMGFGSAFNALSTGLTVADESVEPFINSMVEGFQYSYLLTLG